MRSAPMPTVSSVSVLHLVRDCSKMICVYIVEIIPVPNAYQLYAIDCIGRSQEVNPIGSALNWPLLLDVSKTSLSISLNHSLSLCITGILTVGL